MCAQDLYGWSALHYATRRRHAGIVNLLLQNGADANAMTVKGATPLWYACDPHESARIQREIVHLLMKAGADPNAANAQGETPLQRVRQQGRQALECLMLKYGSREKL